MAQERSQTEERFAREAIEEASRVLTECLFAIRDGNGHIVITSRQSRDVTKAIENLIDAKLAAIKP